MFDIGVNAQLFGPSQLHDDESPVFREPWEAQVFALVISLYENGAFKWSEWAVALSTEIASAKEHGEVDYGDTYYHYWLNALEKLLISKGLENSSVIDARVEAWRQAYMGTPHGQPVELDQGQI